MPRLALRTGFSSPRRAGSQATLRSSTAFEQLSESITVHSHLQAPCLFFPGTFQDGLRLLFACLVLLLCCICYFAAPACLQAARPCACNFPRIATSLKHCKALMLKTPLLLWKWPGPEGSISVFPLDWRGVAQNQGFSCLEIMPKSVRPFTKNCMARATSKSPMILTRMRMPVSPRKVRTRLAPASTK